MATSLDGKIGPANVDRFVPIGSRYDMENLIALRDDADGILFGASTFRAWPKVHQGNDPQKIAHHFIMSRSLNLDFRAELFQNPEIPITIYSGSENTTPNQSPPVHVEIISIPDQPGQIDLILKHVAQCGVKSLLIEGGGHILHKFITAQVLEELYLTLVPAVIGDEMAPALLGGQHLAALPHIKIRNSRQIGNEIFLHLELQYI
ncbi:MAG: RibD family protein [Candidatus Marinimicrobia bacterium]|nr:RibD family protein [Candidatus Neomarinimicrobiota bacterium]MCF7921177.1 RibD family protein [Candidatus Neomarinimicrobiota bacterium]